MSIGVPPALLQSLPLNTALTWSPIELRSSLLPPVSGIVVAFHVLGVPPPTMKAEGDAAHEGMVHAHAHLKLEEHAVVEPALVL